MTHGCFRQTSSDICMLSLSTPGSCHCFICNPILMTRHGNRERGHYSKRALPKHKTTESHCSLRSTLPSTLGPRINSLTNIVGQPLISRISGLHSELEPKRHFRKNLVVARASVSTTPLFCRSYFPVFENQSLQ
jgi:hypothetical protein